MMLSDREIDKLIQPLIDRQSHINSYVIETIAKRIKEIGTMSSSDAYRLERLLKSGSDVRTINRELARITNLQESHIKKLIRTVAKSAYLDMKPYFDYRRKKFISFEKNEPLQRVVNAIAKQTSGTYINLSQSRAFMIRDLKNPQKLIPTELSKTYYSIIDEAIQASQQGVVDYNTAMRRTLKQLVDSGIRTVEYHPESGKLYSQTVEAATKRNLLDGIRQINQAVQDEVGKQYGADGKEITVHEHSAPDHEPIQGHQFTNKEYEKLQNGLSFQDIDGEQFKAIDRPIGAYNCRHFTYSIIVGVNKPNFTKKQLQESIERNKKGYTDANGKHYTLYECTQKQRELERNIRKAKSTIMAAKSAGDSELIKQAKAELFQQQSLYKSFSSACGLPRKTINTRVQGYKA